jgi:hypothetical protein
MPTTELTLSEIAETKHYLSPNGTAYKHPLDYLDKFVSQYGNQLVYDSSHHITNINENGTENTAIGRLKVELRTDFDDIMDNSIGIILAFDQGTVRLYSGANVRACTNLTIFNASWVKTTQLHRFSNDNINDLLDEGMNRAKEMQERIEAMKRKLLPIEDIYILLGKAILDDTIKFPETDMKNAVRSILEKYKPTAAYDTGVKYVNEWDVYNSFTEQLHKRKDIYGAPYKSAEAYNLLKLV